MTNIVYSLDSIAGDSDIPWDDYEIAYTVSKDL